LSCCAHVCTRAVPSTCAIPGKSSAACGVHKPSEIRCAPPAPGLPHAPRQKGRDLRQQLRRVAHVRRVERIRAVAEEEPELRQRQSYTDLADLFYSSTPAEN
jgi:hypothetical protein